MSPELFSRIYNSPQSQQELQITWGPPGLGVGLCCSTPGRGARAEVPQCHLLPAPSLLFLSLLCLVQRTLAPLCPTPESASPHLRALLLALALQISWPLELPDGCPGGEEGKRVLNPWFNAIQKVLLSPGLKPHQGWGFFFCGLWHVSHILPTSIPWGTRGGGKGATDRPQSLGPQSSNRAGTRLRTLWGLT